MQQNFRHCCFLARFIQDKIIKVPPLKRSFTFRRANFVSEWSMLSVTSWLINTKILANEYGKLDIRSLQKSLKKMIYFKQQSSI